MLSRNSESSLDELATLKSVKRFLKEQAEAGDMTRSDQARFKAQIVVACIHNFIYNQDESLFV